MDHLSGPVVHNQEATSPQTYQIKVWGLVSLLLLSTLKELIRPSLGYQAQVRRQMCRMKGWLRISRKRKKETRETVYSGGHWHGLRRQMGPNSNPESDPWAGWLWVSSLTSLGLFSHLWKGWLTTGLRELRGTTCGAQQAVSAAKRIAAAPTVRVGQDGAKKSPPSSQLH